MPLIFFQKFYKENQQTLVVKSQAVVVLYLPLYSACWAKFHHMWIFTGRIICSPHCVDDGQWRKSEPLYHPLRETYSSFLLLTTWASQSQSKHSDACGWADDCQTSGPAGLHVTRAQEGTFHGQVCMWCGKPRTPGGTLRSHIHTLTHTWRGQLPSIKPETPATAVPYAQNQAALIWASHGRRYGAWKITGEKIIILSKGAS